MEQIKLYLALSQLINTKGANGKSMVEEAIYLRNEKDNLYNKYNLDRNSPNYAAYFQKLSGSQQETFTQAEREINKRMREISQEVQGFLEENCIVAPNDTQIEILQKQNLKELYKDIESRRDASDRISFVIRLNNHIEPAVQGAYETNTLIIFNNDLVKIIDGLNSKTLSEQQAQQQFIKLLEKNDFSDPEKIKNINRGLEKDYNVESSYSHGLINPFVANIPDLMIRNCSGYVVDNPDKLSLKDRLIAVQRTIAEEINHEIKKQNSTHYSNKPGNIIIPELGTILYSTEVKNSQKADDNARESKTDEKFKNTREAIEKLNEKFGRENKKKSKDDRGGFIEIKSSDLEGIVDLSNPDLWQDEEVQKNNDKKKQKGFEFV